MFEMIKFPYNDRAVARLDSNNVVHNHLYHNCPIGKVDENNIIYNINNEPIGRVDKNGTVYSHKFNDTSIGKVLENGFIEKDGSLIGKVNANDPLASGGAYLLLVHDNR
ncbi:hypothetical protein [Romboutsia lituseburensis]|uniref:hypothetical protein n=1 Tax=Romboutsia lituseburensis TaxID=1537 RepID=UPI00215AAD1C|nr:hypothetical protein [Romboutsia lituseburensis]MCR8746368.1 hypothetical protein [Romboutsia lituseburensis]